MDTALAQIEELMGEPFGTTPHLTIEDDPDFWALAEMRGDEFHVVVGNGVVNALQELWENALDSGACVVTKDGQVYQPAAEDMVHVSLVWLILHELQHYDLGHFDVSGVRYLAETPKAHRYALVNRIEMPVGPVSQRELPRPDSELPLEQQLELQADADAIELLLDAPSSNAETQDELRLRAACVGAVLLLIDREEREVESSGPHHPCAQARIAQLIAYAGEAGAEMLPLLAKAMATKR